ncbi:MAG: hypothetical protein PSN04_06860 [Methyloprofundus sp.]|nr:hypothetical protein [Methyloprofundus sp.]
MTKKDDNVVLVLCCLVNYSLPLFILALEEEGGYLSHFYLMVAQRAHQ